AGPSLVPGRPVPSRAQVAPARAAPAVRRLRARGARAEARAARRQRLRSGEARRGARRRRHRAPRERRRAPQRAALGMKRFAIGAAEAGGARLAVIAGPCVVESAELCLEVGAHLKAACAARDLPFVFKASYRKANRSSGRSFTGLPMDKA